MQKLMCEMAVGGKTLLLNHLDAGATKIFTLKNTNELLIDEVCVVRMSGVGEIQVHFTKNLVTRYLCPPPLPSPHRR